MILYGLWPPFIYILMANASLLRNTVQEFMFRNFIELDFPACPSFRVILNENANNDGRRQF